MKIYNVECNGLICLEVKEVKGVKEVN